MQFKMVEERVSTAQLKSLIDTLWKKFPQGLIAYVAKGKVPEKFRVLAKYLVKYVASQPIGIRRIMN
jgi:hypothetical protein